MQSLINENLISCIMKHEDKNFFYIVMELADEDLSQIVLKQRLLNEHNKESAHIDESKVLEILL